MNTDKKERGKIIVIEGADGCGKETQSKLLEERLREKGIDVYRHSFPTYNTKQAGPVELYLRDQKIGGIDDLTVMQASALYAVDRLCTYKIDKWDELLENGTWLIFDRYVESNIIYQAAKVEKDMIDTLVDTISTFEYNLLGLPKPDKIFYLDLESSVSTKLIDQRKDVSDINEENIEYIKKVHNIGFMLAINYNWNPIMCTQINKYTEECGIKPINEISDMIWNKLF